MARKKETPKPLLAFKHDFYDSLDNVLQRGINLIQAVEMVVQMGGLSEALKKPLQENCTAFREAVFTKDE